MRSPIRYFAAALVVSACVPAWAAQTDAREPVPVTDQASAASPGGQGGPGRPAPAQAPRAVMPVPVDPKLGPQAFSVVLVVAEMGNAVSVDNVPPAARKALNDMKDFLPYKSYRLLDSQWTLCCGRETIYNRLRGVDGEEYELRLHATVSQAGNQPAPTVNVQQFWLAEAGGNPNELATLREAINQRRKTATSAPDEELRVLEAELAAASRRSSNRTIINTSFRMDVGETVVVGTSRIQGDKALIALLTAVPPKGAAR